MGRREASMSRCHFLMQPPTKDDKRYQEYINDPSTYQDNYRCPCTKRSECLFKDEVEKVTGKKF